MIINLVRTDLNEFYANKTGTGKSSGFDLYTPDDVVFAPRTTTFVDLGIQATTENGYGFFLMPRSSLAKTPLRLANSIGLIDGDYRGNLIAALYNLSEEEFKVPRGTRLVQIVQGNLAPFKVSFGSLDNTERGSGGFGSTGGDVNYIR